MTEEELQEEFGLPVEEEEAEAEEVETEEAEQPEPEPEGDKPADLPKGYMTQEEWVAAGNDPDEWRSPEVFKERGYWLKKQREMKQEFENRIENLNTLQQAQLTMQRQELTRRRDEAIDMADKEAVRGFDKQIKTLDDQAALVAKQPAQQQQVEIPPVVQQWNQRNPWINDDKDPRTAYAQRLFAKSLNETGDYEQAVRTVDAAIATHFGQKKKATPAPVEDGKTRSRGKDAPQITFNDLTAQEQKIWDSGLFANKSDFLKAVADDRKGAKS